MTYEDVTRLMKEHKIWPYSSAINEDKPLSEVALCLDKKNGKFRFYILERDRLQREWYFDTEDAACRKFLHEMAIDHPNDQSFLKKYFRKLQVQIEHR